MALQFSRIEEPVGFGRSSLANAKPIRNKDSDVSILQDMLNNIPVSQGGRKDPTGQVKPLKITGKIVGAADPTVQAIRHFQQVQFGWADGVVDPKSSTENRMHSLRSGNETPTPPSATIQDMVVLIKGFGPAMDGAGTKLDSGAGEPQLGIPSAATFKEQIEAQIPGYTATHRPVIIEYWLGGGGQAKPSSDPSAKIIQSIKDAFAGAVKAGGTVGRLIVMGYSSGGRNAVTVARLAGKDGVPDLAYLGVADAAFDNETDAERTTGGLKIKASDHLFESLTNELRTEDLLPGLEFHGDINGCVNQHSFDQQPIFQARKAAFDNTTFFRKKAAENYFDAQHKDAVSQGMRTIRNRAISILR